MHITCNVKRQQSYKMSEGQELAPENAPSTVDSLISAKSKRLYEFAYQRFLKWCDEHNATKVSEQVMLAYFTTLAKSMKSSSLWAQYSMIKAELNTKRGVKIESYAKLQAFLRTKNVGYIPKKANTFTKEQFDTFLREAPDKKFLALKVILLFGVRGACRCEEIININVNEIKDCDTRIVVNIPDTKTKRPRVFSIFGDFYIGLYRKYAVLRPDNMNTSRFFIKYQNGRCHRTVIGVHKVSSTPREVASYLNLPHPTDYTGHSFRRTSAKLLVASGNFRFTTEVYVENSINNKTETEQPLYKSPFLTEAADDFGAYNSDGDNPQPTELVLIKEEPTDFCDDMEEIVPDDNLEIKKEDSSKENIDIKFAEQCIDYAIQYLKQCTKTNLVHQIMLLENFKRDLPTYE